MITKTQIAYLIGFAWGSIAISYDVSPLTAGIGGLITVLLISIPDLIEAFKKDEVEDDRRKGRNR